MILCMPVVSCVEGLPPSWLKTYSFELTVNISNVKSGYIYKNHCYGNLQNICH